MWIYLSWKEEEGRSEGKELTTLEETRYDIKHINFCVAKVNAWCIVLVQAYIIHLWRGESCAGMTHINNVPHTMDSVQREESPNGTSPENLCSFSTSGSIYNVVLLGALYCCVVPGRGRGWDDFLRDPITSQVTWWCCLCWPLHSWRFKFEGSVSWGVFYDSSYFWN